MNKYINLFTVTLIFLLFTVFSSWILPGLLLAGDLPYYFKSTFNDWSFMPYLWHLERGSGLGGSYSFFLWDHFLRTVPILALAKLGFGWEVIQRLVYFYPFLILASLSSFVLSRKVGLSKNTSILSILIFILNPFILMLVGGGQLEIGLAYAIVPLVFVFFAKILDEFSKTTLINLRNSFLAGFILSLEVMFDIRIAFIACVAVAIYFIVKFIASAKISGFRAVLIENVKLGIYFFLIPILVVFAIHFYWIFPLLLIRENPLTILGDSYSSSKAVEFLSFAKFENAISLLQPYWPENIFGKVGFMKPEFLLIPILAFSSLFFVSKTRDPRTKGYVLFFALLGLIGAFLAKGSSDPFGSVYLFLFNHVPGFNLFRDPIKWSVLVAVSYSILIPFSIWNIYGILSSKFKVQSSNVQFKIQKFIPNLFLILISLFLILLIRPALFGQLTGTFKTQIIPNDYIKLEKLISSDKSFYRTFWLPTYDQFSYYSYTHPLVHANEFLNISEPDRMVAKFNDREFQKTLSESAIKYVIVPYDSQGTIFLTDRKYDENKFNKITDDVSRVSGLNRLSGFDKLAVFERKDYKDHFWTTSDTLSLKYKYVSPVEYKVEVKNAKMGDSLVFSESYDSNWVAINDNIQINSKQYDKLFNSFTLLKNGNYELEVYYAPQKHVDVGLIISLITPVLIVVFLALSFKRNKSR